MQLAQPLWILAGALTCVVLALVLYRMQKCRLEVLQKFASAQLLGRLTRHVSPEKRKLKNILLLLAVFMVFVALARPQYGFKWLEVKIKGIDILFALDTSKSMLAEDTRPNRLQRAKLGILDFIEQLEGDRIGLMPFAGSSYLMCPLTLDYHAFRTSLGTVDTDIIPLGGTSISEVIRSAEQVLSNDSNHKILILITDGEDLEGDVIQAAQEAKEKGMTIFTVGVGTVVGELIPLGSDGGFAKDSKGHYVTSRLDEGSLKKTAETTGGIYAPLGSGGEGLQRIYQEKLQLIPKEELAERRHKIPLERFTWPLAAAIILLVIDFLVPERKGNGSSPPPEINTAGRRARKEQLLGVFLALVFSASCLSPQRAAAGEGEEAYQRQDYLQASEYYSQALKASPGDPALHYNFGTTAYKNNLFDQAAASFTEALHSADLGLQQKAYFNLGNSLFMQGMEKEQARPQEAIKQWQQALDAYQSALQLNNEDLAAAENKAYVEKKIEELKERLEQEESQQEQQEQQENSSENDQQQQSDHDGQPQQSEQSPGQDEKKDAEEKAPQPEPGSNEAQPAQTPENGQDEADVQRDTARREQGKMTREEAENLLNELKGEEGELNFVPTKEGAGDNDSRRDW